MSNIDRTQHIYFCADNKYIPFSSVTMTSILINADEDDDIFFHIIGDDITDQTKERLKELRSIRDFRIEFIDVDPAIFKEFEGKVKISYWSMAMFYRLLIPMYAPEGVDNVLYLDGDMIVRHSLADLFAHDLTDCMAAVVEEPDAVQIKNLGLKSGKYFNSGMLLMNLEEIKKTELLKDAFEFFLNNHPKIICGDQDVLNGIWDGKVKFVEDKYNAVSFNRLVKDPVVFHFTGFMKKPWHYFAKSPYKAEWVGYLQMSPYKKTACGMFKFKLKEFLSRMCFVIKDPTHKSYYIVQLLGIKFGVGEKDDGCR
tara:strand:- start:2324 stop:3256 length:933 start_codon:yes stop_codon:yes gene_type:complete